MPWVENRSAEDISRGNYKDPGRDTILIQIASPDGHFPLPAKPFQLVYRLRFSDIEDSHPDVGWAGINDEQADYIANILKYAKAHNLNVVVHCYAGLCRSGAVCEAAVRMGFKDPHLIRFPNRRVLRKVMCCLGLNP
jgi:predicted protein tyrosine phosphatase